MNQPEPYDPGAARGAKVETGQGDTWTLVFVRELRHAPEKVWQALTDPAQLREWAPFEVDGSLAGVGARQLTWVGNPQSFPIHVTRAEAPRLLEYDGTRWELEPIAGGTRLTLRQSLGRQYISMGAAGWHIALDVLDRRLAGTPIGRMAGGELMGFGGWQRLNGEYAAQFGVEPPAWPPKA